LMFTVRAPSFLWIDPAPLRFIRHNTSLKGKQYFPAVPPGHQLYGAWISAL